MGLYMLFKTAVMLGGYLERGYQSVHMEAVEIVISLRGVDEHQAHTLVVIEVGGYEVDAPEVGDGEVAVARSVLALARIARGAQIDVGEEAAHIRIVSVYSGRQNGILVRLRGGLPADDKTEFFPATLRFISKLNVPYGGRCV